MNKGRHTPSDNLLHFTNREKEQDILRRILALPEGATVPVVVFYGVGGTGKTWLTQKLQKLLETQEIPSKAEPAVPCARLDMDIPKGGGVYHYDAARPYGEIRRQLNVPCPRFDLALAMLRHKQGVQDEPGLRHGEAGNTAWEFVKEGAAAALNSVLGGNLITWAADKVGKQAGRALLGTPFGEYVLSKTGNQDYFALQRMTPDALYAELPRRLGEDLDIHLPARSGHACRGVIFLDTFEALRADIENDERQYERERWVVSLYEHLNHVLIIIAGRDALIWDRVDGDWRDASLLEQHLVGGLSRHDAESFLGKCGVVQARLQSAVLRVCVDTETAPTTLGEIAYHPYSLGLCADTIATERSRGVETNPESFDMAPGDYERLASRFLKSLPSNTDILWMERLALTPRFDRDAARHALGNPTGPPWEAAWKELRGFSFVMESDLRCWFILHPRMRDALRSRIAATPETEHTAHTFWRDYYAAFSSDTMGDYIALTWYHHFRLAPEAALSVWNTLATSSRTGNKPDMAIHYELLSWWQPTNIEESLTVNISVASALFYIGTELCHVSLGNREENLRRAFVCYNIALKIYTEKDFPQHWAATQMNLAVVYGTLPTGNRGQNLQRSIACSDAALRVITQETFPQRWATIQNSRGNAYLHMPTGDQGQNIQNAIDCYYSALRVYTEIHFPEEWAMVQNNMGNAYNQLPAGNRDKNLHQAIDYYTAAVRVRTKRDFPQDWAVTQNNLGFAYCNLQLGVRGRNLQSAIDCFNAALEIRTEEDFPQQWAETQHNLAFAYLLQKNIREVTTALHRAMRGYRAVGLEAQAQALELTLPKILAAFTLIADETKDTDPETHSN